MNKNKKIIITASLSSAVFLPFLPFIVSCSNTNKLPSSNTDTTEPTNPSEPTNPDTTKIINIDSNKEQVLSSIIQNNVNKTTIVNNDSITNIQNKLLSELNNLFNENDVFTNATINLIKPDKNSDDNLYNAVVELSINNEYKLSIDEQTSNFVIQDGKLIFKSPLKTSINLNEYSQLEAKQKASLTNIGSNNIKYLGSHKRTPQTEFYSTELMKKYGDDYGFVYPGYNRNYKANGGTGDDFYRKPTADQSLPERIDAMQLVYDERVEGHPGVTYNNSSWISNEIENNTFKKHPAASNFFENNIDDIDSVDMHYDLSTCVTGKFELGLYAPPGEVVTITFDDDTFNEIVNSNWNGSIVINENFWDVKTPGGGGQISNRYPYLESRWTLDKNTKSLKFGSPFGGGISIWINKKLYQNDLNTPFSNSIQNIKFKVTGAIPCMFYQDGSTTEEQWEEQKRLVKENKLAPIIQVNAPLHAFTLPFSGSLNRIGEYTVDDLKYPAKNFKKWDDFLYLSNYYAGRDLDNNLQRLDMKFSDDIWGDALAWGGGMVFYCPINWGAISFFVGEPLETFNPTNSWGVFHEINHNYQQDSALFSRREHGETNQVIAFNMSVISDYGRARSELNYSGDPVTSNEGLGWQRLNNPFITIYDIVNRGSTDEYPIYSLLLFMFGPKRYSDYLRWDVRNHPNTMNGWTGFKEIETLSNHFKLNLWPAFFDYGKYWSDTWPTSTNQITQEQQNVINELATNYPAIDFVANHYATGNYVYNSQTNEFEYGGDVTSPWEIEAGKPFILDLKNFIISTNRNFNWNIVTFDETTVNGGKLKLLEDQKLEYTPPQDPTIIDEFDISIIPDNWDGKPSNYVHEYKFKIKMRQVVNEPIFTLYENLPDTNIDNNFVRLFNDQIKVKYTQPLAIFNTKKFTNSSVHQAVKLDFNFVAPKDSTYSFKAKWDDATRILFDGNEIFCSNQWSNREFRDLQTKEMKKGETLHIEAYVINAGGGGDIDFQVYDSENNSIDWMKNVLIPNYKDVTDPNLTPLEILSADKYQYKSRTIDKDIFDSDLTSNINLSDYNITYYDPSKYKLYTKHKESDINNLNNFGTTYFELWNKDQNQEKGQTQCKFQVDFIDKSKPTLVSSLYFGHKTDDYYDSRPTHIRVLGHQLPFYVDPGVVLYEGPYGGQFGDRNKDYSVINFDNPLEVYSLEIVAYNEAEPWYQLSNRGNGIIFRWFRCSGESYNKIKANISINDPRFTFNENWTFKHNDEENDSAFNNLYTISKKEGDKVKIDLKNKLGFNLIGQTNQTPTQINVYVNGQKVNEQPVTISSDTRIDNHCLFQYRAENKQNLIIEIEHLDNNPLYLNYIMVF